MDTPRISNTDTHEKWDLKEGLLLKCRMPDSCPTRRVLVSDLFGTRRRGAQRGCWLDQVESNLSEIGCSRGWRTAAQDRVSWKRIGDLAMSTRRART